MDLPEKKKEKKLLTYFVVSLYFVVVCKFRYKKLFAVEKDE